MSKRTEKQLAALSDLHRRVRTEAPPKKTPMQLAAARLTAEVAAKAALIDWDAQPLGQVPDTHIAMALGISHTRVMYARRARGIAAYVPD